MLELINTPALNIALTQPSARWDREPSAETGDDQNRHRRDNGIVQAGRAQHPAEYYCNAVACTTGA